MSTRTRAEKPRPDLEDPWYRPFWEGTRSRRLLLQHCNQCGYVRWPPAPICPECLSRDGEWRDTATDGAVYSVAVYEHCYNQAFRDDIPYNVVLVELDAGPRMMSNLVGVPNEDVTVGMRVSGEFDQVDDDLTLLRFHPVDQRRSG